MRSRKGHELRYYLGSCLERLDKMMKKTHDNPQSRQLVSWLGFEQVSSVTV
jgi:hypothetical protein